MTSRSRRMAAVASVAAVAVLVAIVIVSDPFGSRAAAKRALPTAFARIVRTDVVERQQVSGTLDYSGTFTITNPADAGIATWLPTPGERVRRGGPLYILGRVAARLLYGGRPASRDLSLGVSGADVRELQQNLSALGFEAGGALHVNGRFDLPTLVAVERWQHALGEAVTGYLPLGTVVFLPGATRVAALAASAGATVQTGAPILSATSIEPAVLVPLDPGTVAQLAVGDTALVTMPDNSTIRGRVSSIGRVATVASAGSAQGNTGPTVPVTISLLDPGTRGGLDQAPVQVAITEQAVRHVLAVPISALLAQPGGGYAITVAEGATTKLVPVTTGLFDDVAGRVEIRGPGIAVGMRVEVPSG